MDGPEIAGELYKVFKQWLSQRILQGFTPAEVVQKRLSGPAFYIVLHCFELFLGVFWGN